MQSLKRIWLSSPHMGVNERMHVEDIFNTNWIAPVGPHINQFENMVASYLNSDVQVVALNSGTSALHLGMVLLGVEKDDEVICQSMTFAATANPVVYQQATPIFVDSEPGTWNMSPYWLEAAIKDRIRKGRKPKVIVPVHLYGMPCMLNEIKSIAANYDIPILEDAAEALGSTYYGRQMGTFGDMGVISFNGNKIITTSSGGVLITKDRKMAERAKFLSTQAKDPAPHFEHSNIGFNYRISNVCAGIGCGQMDVLQDRIEKRRHIFAWYKNIFENTGGVCFQQELPGMYSNRWLTAILLKDDLISEGFTPESLRLYLDNQNIESRPTWKPLHLQPVFKHAPYYGEGISDYIFNQGLCLPSGSNMTAEDLYRIEEVLYNYFSTAEVKQLASVAVA